MTLNARAVKSSTWTAAPAYWKMKMTWMMVREMRRTLATTMQRVSVKREEFTDTAMDTEDAVGVVAERAVEANLDQMATEATAKARAGAADGGTTTTTTPVGMEAMTGVIAAMAAEATEAMTGVTVATAIDAVVDTMVATTDTEREAQSLAAAKRTRS